MTKKQYFLVAVVAAVFGLAGGLLSRFLPSRPVPKETAALKVPGKSRQLETPDKEATGAPSPSIDWVGSGPAEHVPASVPTPGSTEEAAPDAGTAASSSKGEPEYVLKIATLPPEGSSVVGVLREMERDIAAKTGGRIRLKLYPGGMLGEDKTILNKIKLGQLQGGVVSEANLGEILPAVRVLDIPFYFDGYEELDAAYSAVNAKLTRMLEEVGWVELGRADQGFAYLFSANQARTVDDLRKAKLVIWADDPVVRLIANETGNKPIPQDGTDVLTSLMMGMVDTVFVLPAYVPSLQWNRVLRYALDLPVANAAGIIVLRRKAFEQIPPDLQPIVLDVTRRYGKEIVARNRREQTEALAWMRSHDVQLTTMDDEDRRGFHRIGERVRGKMPAALYPDEDNKQELVRELIEAEVAAVEALRAGAPEPASQ